MSEVKYSHTPGPWKVKAAEFKGNGILAYEIVMPRCEINQANADLIEAAPKLLAACRKVCSAFLKAKLPIPFEYLQDIKAMSAAVLEAESAIALADGSTPR